MQTHTRHVYVIRAQSAHQAQSRESMCTPTSLTLVRASFRDTTNNNRGEREEDGEKRRSKKRMVTESVREIEGRKEEGGLGIASANHSSQETYDELQK